MSDVQERLGRDGRVNGVIEIKKLVKQSQKGMKNVSVADLLSHSIDNFFKEYYTILPNRKESCLWLHFITFKPKCEALKNITFGIICYYCCKYDINTNNWMKLRLNISIKIIVTIINIL